MPRVNSTSTPVGRKENVREDDALSCLKQEHAAIRRLFRDYEGLVRRKGSDDKKADVASQICHKWCLHTQIEEELFYPLVKLALNEELWVNHALDDHIGSRELVAMLDEMEPGDANFDPAVATLAAYVLPHMDEEEGSLFPQLRQLGVDTVLLGRDIIARQKTLNGDVTQVWHAWSGRLSAHSPLNGSVNGSVSVLD